MANTEKYKHWITLNLYQIKIKLWQWKFIFDILTNWCETGNYVLLQMYVNAQKSKYSPQKITEPFSRLILKEGI